MKYNDFKIFKFSTILKNIDRIRDSFSRIYKKTRVIPGYVVKFFISVIGYIFSGVYDGVIFVIKDFLKIYKTINIRRYNFPNIYKYIDFRKYNFFNIYKNVSFKKYNFPKISRRVGIKNIKILSIYISGFVIFIAFIYINIPMFFNYEKSKIEDLICKEVNVECYIKGEIKYSFFPSPRIKFNDFIIKDFIEKNKILGKIENGAIKISFYNLYDHKKFNYTKVKFTNADINFNLKKLDLYKNFFRKKFNSKPIILTKSEIKFFEDEKEIAVIRNVNFKFNSSENIDKATLKGNFLDDKIFISLESKKNGDDPSKVFILKLLDLKLFTQLDISGSNLNKNTINGNLLFKQKKNRLSAVFDYENDRINIKNASLKNFFTEGELDGDIRILPYFEFDLNLDLKKINFYKLHNFFINLDETNKKKFFRINNKINGQLKLSGDKIYSKYSLINSFESRLQFVNGDILFDQLLLSLGKLGAADLTGIIKNEKQFTNFKFEKNIFLDDLKHFYNKFGIYNKENTPSTLFVSGIFDLVNFNLHLKEVSTEKNFKNEDVEYIQKEFNEIVLEDGYVSLFSFLKLKEFIRSINLEIN